METVVNYEVVFDSDLNNDGAVGHTVTDIDTTGVGLQSSTRNAYHIVDGADVIDLSFRGQLAGPESFPGWSAVAAGSDGAAGYNILWQNADIYTIWEVNAAGAYTGTADMSNMIDYEDVFLIDFNEDGEIWM